MYRYHVDIAENYLQKGKKYTVVRHGLLGKKDLKLETDDYYIASAWSDKLNRGESLSSVKSWADIYKPIEITKRIIENGNA